MPRQEFSLPPLLNDSIQGRLDLIMRRPVLVMPLPPHQELEVEFAWWGSTYLHHIRFLSHIEEVKLIFNIHCDLKGLQRYFDDSPAIEIEVSISAAPVNKNEESVMSLNKDKSLPCRYSKYQLKNKQWKSGESIGKFVISKIQFNTRGEFVDECDIFNPSGEHCGAVVIFMLHTDLRYVDCASHKEDSQIRKNDHLIAQLQIGHSSFKKSIEKIFLSEKLDSPHFIPFERGKNDLHEKYNGRELLFHNEFEKVNSPPKRPNLKKSIPPNHSSKSLVSPDSKCSQFAAEKYENLNCQILPLLTGSIAVGSKHISKPHLSNSTNGNFMLKKLFSFVDSGAIQPTDLPALIQICQGRSPSLEFDSSELNLTYHESMDEPKVCQLTTPTKVPAVAKRKKSVNFSTNSHINTSFDENPKTYQVFDDKFMSLLSKQKTPTQKSNSSLSYQTTKFDKTACPLPNSPVALVDTSVTCNNSKEESTLFILMFHSIQLTPDNSKAGSDQKNNVVKTHKTKVRQRSCLCYFIEVILACEEMDQSSQSALFISRQVENEEVIYDENRIFHLFNSPEELLRSEPYIKFDVSRRRLGNRLREDVGVGIIRLKQLLGSQNRPVILPLWGTAGWRCGAEKGKLETPVGNLNFKVAFAYATVPQQTSKEPYSFPISTGGKAFDIVTEQRDMNGCTQNDEPKTRMDKSFKISGLNYPTSEPVQEFPKISPSQASLLIENSGCMNFVPGKIDPQGKVEIVEQNVHLEILEGNGLPLLRKRGMQMAFPPSSYVQIKLKSIVYCTKVVPNSPSPKWNYTADFLLSTGDLKDTNLHLVLKLFHRLGGALLPTCDPMLGFATIDTHFLWSSFISLCGWIPVLNMEGELCGEIKVSLTPKLRSTQICERQPGYPSLDIGVRPDSVDKGTQGIKSTCNFECPYSHNHHDSEMAPPEGFPRLKHPLNCKTTLAGNLNICEELLGQESLGLSNEQPKSCLIPASANPNQSPTGIKPPLADSYGKDVPLGLAQVIEGLQWMNHTNSFDTPCVSYLDLGNPEPTKNPQKTKKVKQRRRIAANLNFF